MIVAKRTAMGQQIKKVIKRRRRKVYLRRKNEQVKLGGTSTKVRLVKKAPADATGEKPAKKAPAKKAAAKKAPAKKAAKVVEETPAAEESSEA